VVGAKADPSGKYCSESRQLSCATNVRAAKDLMVICCSRSAVRSLHIVDVVLLMQWVGYCTARTLAC
jgi:hypothetical protein